MAIPSLAHTLCLSQEASASPSPVISPRVAGLSTPPAKAPLSPNPQLSEAKKLFFEFLGLYFGGIEVFGVQCGFGPHKDTYVCRGPYGTTVSFETDIVLRPREEILEIVKARFAAKTQQFEKSNPANFSEVVKAAVQLGEQIAAPGRESCS